MRDYASSSSSSYTSSFAPRPLSAMSTLVTPPNGVVGALDAKLNAAPPGVVPCVNNNHILLPGVKKAASVRRSADPALPRRQNAMLRRASVSSWSPPLSPGAESLRSTASSLTSSSIDETAPVSPAAPPAPPAASSSTRLTPPPPSPPSTPSSLPSSSSSPAPPSSPSILPLDSWLARFEHAIPCETLLRQRLVNLCATGGVAYPADTGIQRSHPSVETMRILLKLHEPFLKLYVEEFYRQMRRTCVDTLTAMHDHYENTLRWMRTQLDRALERVVRSVRAAGRSGSGCGGEGGGGGKRDTSPSSTLTRGSNLQDQKRKTESGADAETSPGDSGNSLGNSEEDILAKGRKERLHFRFPAPTPTEGVDEGALELAEYILHLHKKIKTLETKSAEAKRQHNQLSLLCSLAAKRLESHETERDVSLKTRSASQLRQTASTPSSDRSSSFGGGPASPISPPPTRGSSSGLVVGGGASGATTLAWPASSPSSNASSNLARRGERIRANASAFVKGAFPGRFRKQQQQQEQRLRLQQQQRLLISGASRLKSASETNLAAPEDGLGVVVEVKERRGVTDGQIFGGGVDRDRSADAGTPPSSRGSSLDLPGAVDTSRPSSRTASSAAPTSAAALARQGRVLPPDVLDDERDAGSSARAGRSLPASRAASVDDADEDRIHSLPVIELPDGMFDTVKRRKGNEGKKEAEPKRRSLAFMGSSLASATSTNSLADDDVVAGLDECDVGSGGKRSGSGSGSGKAWVDVGEVANVVKRKASDSSNRKQSWRRSMPAILSGLKMKISALGSTNDLRKIGAMGSSMESDAAPSDGPASAASTGTADWRFDLPGLSYSTDGEPDAEDGRGGGGGGGASGLSSGSGGVSLSPYRNEIVTRF